MWLNLLFCAVYSQTAKHREPPDCRQQEMRNQCKYLFSHWVIRWTNIRGDILCLYGSFLCFSCKWSHLKTQHRIQCEQRNKSHVMFSRACRWSSRLITVGLRSQPRISYKFLIIIRRIISYLHPAGFFSKTKTIHALVTIILASLFL